MYPKVSINIVAWNSLQYLPDLLRSIDSQTWRDFNVLIIDNASDDGLGEFLAREYPSVVLLRNQKNRGFSYAHNQGIRYALEHWSGEDLSDRFVLVTNPDIILEPDFLEKMLAASVAHPRAASFGGKLLRAFGENVADPALRQVVVSNDLDSTGLLARRDRTFTDRGAGETDRGQYDAATSVFGFSGALALYRASSLAAAGPNFEYFDNNFFAYKEDVDLAWRLQNLGQDAVFVPAARAYHYRAMFGLARSGWWQTFRNRFGKSRRRSFFSTRNQLLLQIKNERLANWVLSLPRVLFGELRRFIFICIFETANLSAYWSALTMLPAMWRKRAALRSHWVASAKSLRRWFV